MTNQIIGFELFLRLLNVPKTISPIFLKFIICGDKRDRTADLVNAIHALSQLSYIPLLFIISETVIYFELVFKERKKGTKSL